jgi:hypothetical protein
MFSDNGLTDVGFSEILDGFSDKRTFKPNEDIKKITYSENELGELSTNIISELVSTRLKKVEVLNLYNLFRPSKMDETARKSKRCELPVEPKYIG